jgi:hypothetical protein
MDENMVLLLLVTIDRACVSRRPKNPYSGPRHPITDPESDAAVPGRMQPRTRALERALRFLLDNASIRPCRRSRGPASHTDLATINACRSPPLGSSIPPRQPRPSFGHFAPFVGCTAASADALLLFAPVAGDEPASSGAVASARRPRLARP